MENTFIIVEVFLTVTMCEPREQIRRVTVGG